MDAESELANLGNSDSRDGYLAEVSSFRPIKASFMHTRAAAHSIPALRGTPTWPALALTLSTWPCCPHQVGKVLMQPSKISKYIGMDMTNLMSVPLFIMEPFSMLQKMAEIMEYTELLDQADAAEDPYERCA